MPAVVDFAVATFDYYPGFVSFPDLTWQDEEAPTAAPAQNLP